MKSLLRKINRFLAGENGPTAVEYAFMLALIVLTCFAAIQTMGERVSGTFTTFVTMLQGSR